VQSLPTKPPLLITESQQDYDELATAMIAYIAPTNVLEEIFTFTVIDETWECRRYQRCRTAMINTAYRPALTKLLCDDLCVIDEIPAAICADNWFKTKAGREEVMTLLKRYQLDEIAIEAEAIKLCGPELETLDRLIASAEQRRSRALRAVSEVRLGVVNRARQISQQLIDRERAPLVEQSEAAE
jgi:hypothetical protein